MRYFGGDLLSRGKQTKLGGLLPICPFDLPSPPLPSPRAFGSALGHRSSAGAAAAEEEVDPLDAFMAGVQQTVKVWNK